MHNMKVSKELMKKILNDNSYKDIIASSQSMIETNTDEAYLSDEKNNGNENNSIDMYLAEETINYIRRILEEEMMMS